MWWRLHALPRFHQAMSLQTSPTPGLQGALENKMVSAPDGKIYVIKNGQRHWILDPRWIGKVTMLARRPFQ